jgi:putative transposase
MPYDPEHHQRRSIRVRPWDYAQPAWYFVTVCTAGRVPLFGDIHDGVVMLSHAGRVVDEAWWETLAIRSYVRLGDYVVMPNHLHGILIIDEQNGVQAGLPSTFRSPTRTLGAVIRGFKGASARQINALRGTPGAPVWQRNYYEHIIRDDRDLDRIRSYIANNPSRRHPCGCPCRRRRRHPVLVVHRRGRMPYAPTRMGVSRCVVVPGHLGTGGA